MDVTHVRCLTGWAGHASLYECDPPFRYEDWVDEKMVETEYVIISAVNSGFAHETYIFAANEDGTTKSMSELPGSYRGGTSHDEAIENMKRHSNNNVTK